jgi:cyclophilin family peptidyl-prolyl cis-trans isomerase/HEAT repeat protein
LLIRRKALVHTGFGLSLGLVLALASVSGQTTRLDKLGRVLALEDGRSIGRGELAAYLTDSDRGVRRRAALAAGRIGDPALVPQLIGQMGDVEAEVRQMTAFALGLIGDARAGDRLVTALADPDARVRGRAAEALGRIGQPAHAFVVAQRVLAGIPEGAPLLAIRGDNPSDPADPWAELRLSVLALARFGDVATAQTALLDGDAPRFDWWAATYVAMRLSGPPMRPLLSAAARSTDAYSRALAAQGLAKFEDEVALAQIVDLTADEDPRVAATALRSLRRFPQSRWAAQMAAAALDSRYPSVQDEALAVLETLPPSRDPESRVVELIGSEDPGLRGRALRLLARLDPRQFAMVRSSLDPDPVWFVRGDMARALAHVGDPGSLQQLFAMLNRETDARVLAVILEALRESRGRDSTPTLVDHLAHADPAVRRAAALGLIELKAQGRVPSLEAAYQRSLADVEIEARLAITQALIAEPGEAVQSLLKRIAAQDPALVVRRAAAKATGTTATAVLRLSASARAALDYKSAAAPLHPLPDVRLFTPRALIHTTRGKFELHLDTLEAPLTTASFIQLAKRGFYDGLDFHRVVTGFVVQGGDPRGDGLGGPGYLLRSEVGQSPAGRGAVGLALAGPDTGGSQFFITQFPAPHLDGEYPLFGQVVRGMEVVDALRPGDRIERIEIWDGR